MALRSQLVSRLQSRGRDMVSQFFRSLINWIKAAPREPKAEAVAPRSNFEPPRFVDHNVVTQTVLTEWASDPSMVWPFLNHRSGHTRQAALKSLSGPIVSVEELIALTQRLNDWVPEVRAGALVAAERLLPSALPDVIERAAPYLVSRWQVWERWDSEGIALIDALVGQPAVVQQIVHSLSGKRFRKVSWRLEHLLRHDWIDAHLLHLAQSAREPSIRKLAFATLLKEEARWRTPAVRSTGEIRYAVDKSPVVYDRRPLTVGVDRVALVENGLQDRFVAVRWLAAGALVDNLVEIPDRQAAITRLLADKSRKVRERGE